MVAMIDNDSVSCSISISSLLGVSHKVRLLPVEGVTINHTQVLRLALCSHCYNKVNSSVLECRFLLTTLSRTTFSEAAAAAAAISRLICVSECRPESM